MRPIQLFFLACAVIACTHTTPDQKTDSNSTATLPSAIMPDTSSTVNLVPLTGSGLKYNGVYHYRVDNIHYVMRFFERGNVALVVGNESDTAKHSIREYLTENVQSGWNNVHNTLVLRHNDSLLFQTMALKGAITYAGVVYADGDSARFLKESKVNGKKAIVEYGFSPDKTLQ